jgi:nitrate reductase NapE component
LLTTNLIENPILRMMVNQIMQMTTRKIILFLVVLFAIWAVLSYLILFVFVFGSVFMFKDQAFTTNLMGEQNVRVVYDSDP